MLYIFYKNKWKARFPSLDPDQAPVFILGGEAAPFLGCPARSSPQAPLLTLKPMALTREQHPLPATASTPPHLRAAPTPHNDTASAPPYSKSPGFSFRVSGRRPGARREKAAGTPIPGAQGAPPPQALALSGRHLLRRCTPHRPGPGWSLAPAPLSWGAAWGTRARGGEGALTSNPEPRPAHCC